MAAQAGLLSCCWSYSFPLGVFHVHEVYVLINFFFSLIFYYRGPDRDQMGGGNIFPPSHWCSKALVRCPSCSWGSRGSSKLTPWGYLTSWLPVAIQEIPNIKVQILLQARTNWYLRFSTGSETVGSQLGKDGKTFPARKVADSRLDWEKPPGCIIWRNCSKWYIHFKKSNNGKMSK